MPYKFYYKGGNSNNTKLLLSVKEFLFFRMVGQQRVWQKHTNSMSLLKVIKIIPSIGLFDQKYVVLRGLFHCEQLKQHMAAIQLNQKFISNTLYNHNFLENIN